MEIITMATGVARDAARSGAFRALGSPSAVSRPRGGWRVVGLGDGKQVTPVAPRTVGAPVGHEATADHNWTGVSVPGQLLCRERT